MYNLTSEAYAQAVKEAIEKAKRGKDALLWNQSSPAQLRDWCRRLYYRLESDSDKRVLEDFFNMDPKADLQKQFDRVDTVPLKSVQNFIRGKSNRTSSANIEMLAVLSDFQPRPFGRFIRRGLNAAANRMDLLTESTCDLCQAPLIQTTDSSRFTTSNTALKWQRENSSYPTNPLRESIFLSFHLPTDAHLSRESQAFFNASCHRVVCKDGPGGLDSSKKKIEVKFPKAYNSAVIIAVTSLGIAGLVSIVYIASLFFIGLITLASDRHEQQPGLEISISNCKLQSQNNKTNYIEPQELLIRELEKPN